LGQIIEGRGARAGFLAHPLHILGQICNDCYSDTEVGDHFVQAQIKQENTEQNSKNKTANKTTQRYSTKQRDRKLKPAQTNQQQTANIPPSCVSLSLKKY
jgi:hypothetical protein